MSESLKDLKQIEAELQANKIKIAKAQQIEDEKQAEKKRKEEAERKEARQKAFVARQNLINLERDIAREVSLYAQFKRKHVKNEITAKWDAFLTDLRGEKKPRKPRKTKTEE